MCVCVCVCVCVGGGGGVAVGDNLVCVLAEYKNKYIRLNFQYNGHPTRLALKVISGVHLLFKFL